MNIQLLRWALLVLLFPGPLFAQDPAAPAPADSTDGIPAPPEEGSSADATPQLTSVPSEASAPSMGFFLGLGGSIEFLWGGFDGDTLRVTAQSVSILAPRLDPGGAFNLYGGLMGPKLPEPFGDLWGELRLKRSQQRWVFQDGQDASTLMSLSLRGRSTFLQAAPLEVFALVGLRYSLLELKNAAEDPDYVIADASYSSLGSELGVGGAVGLPFDLKARVGWVFLLGLTNSGSAFGSSLDENPWFFGGSCEFGLERNF